MVNEYPVSKLQRIKQTKPFLVSTFYVWKLNESQVHERNIAQCNSISQHNLQNAYEQGKIVVKKF